MFSSEAELVAALRSGNPEAFKEAYMRYKRDVLALLATMLGRQEEAWDLLHDIFVSLLARRAPELKPDCNLRGYLMTSAANRARDHLKRRRNKLLTDERIAHTADTANNNPLQMAMQQSEANRLWTILSTLPEEQRIVIALRIYGELTLKEISLREGISENTVQARYRYGLQKLRQKCAGT